MGHVQRAPPLNSRFRRRNRFATYNNRKNNYNNSRDSNSSGAYINGNNSDKNNVNNNNINNNNNNKTHSLSSNHCSIFYNRNFKGFEEDNNGVQQDDLKDIHSRSLSWKDLDLIADDEDVPSLVQLLTSSPLTEEDLDYLCNWRRAAYYFDGLLYLVVSLEDEELNQAYDAFVQRVVEMRNVSVDWWRWHCQNNLFAWYSWSIHYQRNFASAPKATKSPPGTGRKVIVPVEEAVRSV